MTEVIINTVKRVKPQVIPLNTYQNETAQGPLYIRVSVDEQAEKGHSLAHQEESYALAVLIKG